MSTPTNSNESSQIATGTVIKGTVKTTEDIRVDGVVDGELETSGKLIVGDKGQITGKLKTNTAVISGDLNIEKIEADTLTFGANAKFKGDAVYKTLNIEPGAKVEGNLKAK